LISLVTFVVIGEGLVSWSGVAGIGLGAAIYDRTRCRSQRSVDGKKSETPRT